jgi:hypothetical protein
MEKEELAEAQERLRAKFVIEKAEANKWDVVATLLTHMVSRTLIEELTGEVVRIERRAPERKSNALYDWVKTNVGRDFSTGDLISELGVSYDTVLKTVKENPMFFTKVGRGRYEVRDGIAEREAAKKDK